MHMRVCNHCCLRLRLIETSFSDITTNRILLQPHQQNSLNVLGGADRNRTGVLPAIQKLQQLQYYLVHTISWLPKFCQSNHLVSQQTIVDVHFRLP